MFDNSYIYMPWKRESETKQKCHHFEILFPATNKKHLTGCRYIVGNKCSMKCLIKQNFDNKYKKKVTLFIASQLLTTWKTRICFENSRLWQWTLLCPRRPETYPGLMRGNNSFKRARNLPQDLPRNVRIWWDSDQRCPGLWGGTYQGIYKKKVPAVSDVTKYNKVQIESQGKSPLSPGSGRGGWGYNWKLHLNYSFSGSLC